MFSVSSWYQTNTRCIELLFIASIVTFVPGAVNKQHFANTRLSQSSTNHMMKLTNCNHTHGISNYIFKTCVFTAAQAYKTIPISSLFGIMVNLTDKKLNGILITPVFYANWTCVIVSPAITYYRISYQNRPPNLPPNMITNIAGAISVWVSSSFKIVRQIVLQIWWWRYQG